MAFIKIQDIYLRLDSVHSIAIGKNSIDIRYGSTAKQFDFKTVQEFNENVDALKAALLIDTQPSIR